MSDSLPDQDREQRWALVIRQHIFLMGGGRDEQPPSCGCGEWQARSLNYNIGHREWAQHLASAVMALAEAEAAGLRERLTRAEERLAAALALCSRDGYTTWDQIEKLGEPPWRGIDPNLVAWEQAHGHDVRLNCDGDCLLLIDPEDLRAALSADENGTRDE